MGKVFYFTGPLISLGVSLKGMPFTAIAIGVGVSMLALLLDTIFVSTRAAQDVGVGGAIGLVFSMLPMFVFVLLPISIAWSAAAYGIGWAMRRLVL